MLAIIQKYTFYGASAEDSSSLQEELLRYKKSYAEMTTREELLYTFSTLEQKICIKGFPKTDMAYYPLLVLRDIVEIMCEKNIIHKDEVRNCCFQIILACLRAGPSAGMDSAVDVFLKWFDLDDFFKGLNGEPLNMFINACKAISYTEERDTKEIDVARISMRLTKGLIGKVLGRNNKDDLESRQKREIHAKFADLYMFYFMKMSELPASYTEYIPDFLLSSMRVPYVDVAHKQPFWGLPPDMIKQYIWTTKDHILEDGFPQSPKLDYVGGQVLILLLESLLANIKSLVAFWPKVLEVFGSILLCDKISELNDIRKQIKEFFSDKLKVEILVENPTLFDIFAKWLPGMVSRTKTILSVDPWLYYALRRFRDACQKKGLNKKTSAGQWLPLLRVALKWPDKELAYIVRDTLREDAYTRIWEWKVNHNEAKKIIDTLMRTQSQFTEENTKEDHETMDYYGKIVDLIAKQLKFVKKDSTINKEVALLFVALMERNSEGTQRYANEFCNQFVLHDNHEIIPELLRRFLKVYADSDRSWASRCENGNGRKFISAVIDAYADGEKFPDKVNKYMIVILRYSIDGDVDHVDVTNGHRNLYMDVLSTHIYAYINKLNASKTCEVLKPILPGLMRLLDSDEDPVVEAVHITIRLLSFGDGVTVIAPYTPYIVRLYKEDKNENPISCLYNIYKNVPAGFSKKVLEEIYTESLDDSGNRTMQALLFQEISKKQPEFFTAEKIDKLIEVHKDEEYSLGTIIMCLDNVVHYYPEVIGESFIKNILLINKFHSLYYVYIKNIAAAMAIKRKELSQRAFDGLLAAMKNTKDPSAMTMFLDGLRTIAGAHGVAMFKPHRKYFEQLKTGAPSAQMQDMVGNVLDALDGRSLDFIALQFKKQQAQIDLLDDRLTVTEKDVRTVKTQVSQHHEEIRDIIIGLTDVNQRVDTVEGDLAETKIKVEEIDNKTITNAPSWSRDLSKLMNPKTEHDWRLLAKRLGYTAKDIKAWATQHDPCMALLSEWYATHKTVEASRAVLTALQEMNRLDAACIVENVMKSAEDVVEEEVDYITPPAIFLSYQWGHQQEVKLLHKHLVKAGYECWMDIGQMGGGDKLFEKIDNGIRGAKVVICCVSEKYSSSPNCNREVNLSVTLGKPMIPLLMEKMSWPPKGSMGPIFSEYLFVRFFQRPGEERKDQRYWPVPRFQEMLMQLSIYKCLPEEFLISKEYREWWKPAIEEIIIPKRLEKKEQTSSQQNKKSSKEEEKSPDIFLSYQWGKQPQVKALFRVLTKLGFHCWMDIHQMGGGDSLYDKIDRGVRGCSVVLSMVTAKYAVSANCRREVSLADSLKKPIIPLMLEKMDWPPPGPMGMVFTQLLYVNFYRDERVQMTWSGETFKEVIRKMCDHAPALKEFLVDEETSNDGGDKPAIAESKYDKSAALAVTESSSQKSTSVAGVQASQQAELTNSTNNPQTSVHQAQPQTQPQMYQPQMYQQQPHPQQQMYNAQPQMYQTQPQMYQSQPHPQQHMYNAQPQMYYTQPQTPQHQYANTAMVPPHQNQPTQQRTAPVYHNTSPQKESSTCTII